MLHSIKAVFKNCKQIWERNGESEKQRAAKAHHSFLGSPNHKFNLVPVSKTEVHLLFEVFWYTVLQFQLYNY